jgi:hypothetical protein
MENLTDMVSPFGGGMLENLSRFLGESPDATQRALKSVLPTAGYAVADYGSTQSGAQNLIDGFANQRLPAMDVEGVSRSLSDPDATQRLMSSSGGFLQNIVGGRMGGIVDALSTQTGMGGAGIMKLLSLAAPLVLGSISRRVREGNLDAGSLSGFLSQQKTQLGQLLPGGVGNVLGASASRSVVPRSPVEQRVPQRSSMRLGWAIVALAALFAVITFMGRGNRRASVQGRTPTTVGARKATGELPLKDNLNTWFSGAEPSGRFVLKDPDRSAADLSAALLAHPNAQISIESAASSDETAMKRATSLKDKLVSQGVPADRIDIRSRVESGADHMEAVITR